MIGARTRAIMYVPYGGHAGDLSAVAELAERHAITLLKDAAHAVGTRVGGRSAATIGRASAFSFFSNKNLAIGEGGMVTTDDDQLAKRVRLLRSHGMTTDRHRGHAGGYDVVALGFNYRIDEPRAALGLRDEDNARRALLDLRYREALGDAVRCAMPPRDVVQSAHYVFTSVLDEAGRRDGFPAALADGGVQTSARYPPVHGFSIHEAGEQDLALTESYGERSVTPPLFAHIAVERHDRVLRSVLAALEPRAAA